MQANVGHAHSIDEAHPLVLEPPLPPNVKAQYPSPEGSIRYVIDQYKIWKTGTVLNVCFMSGDLGLRQFVADTAQMWTQHGNLRLDFGKGQDLRDCSSQPSHIRIAFNPAGNWSYVGTDSVRTDLRAPSMNLGVASGAPFTLMNRDELRGVILHEFGHAFGLQHEHQSPAAHCEAEFNWPVVYQRLGGPPNSWDKNTVDLNLRPLFVSSRLRLSAYDRQSIMHYSLPSWMFVQGQQSPCFIPPNHGLSALDTEAFSKAYPATPEQQYVYLDSLDNGTRDVLKQTGVNEDLAKQVATSVIELLKADFPNKSITVCARSGGVALGASVENTVIVTKADADTSGVCPAGADSQATGGGVAIPGNVKGSRICTGGAACPP
jgi:hypothetical protein